MIRWQEFNRSTRSDRYKRAKVQGGWMVWSGYGPGRPGTMTFYNDPDHNWSGELFDLDERSVR